MQIRVLYPVVNIGVTIASLLLLIVGLPCQIAGEEMRGSVTITAQPLSPTAIVTGTRFLETPFGTSTQIATDVGRAEITPVPLLTGLARYKPSIWGSKGFYVLLGLIYVTLLGLFIEQIINIAGSGREQC
jgi:hypothetical protein